MKGLEIIILLILALVGGIFFVWGTTIASVKHVGVGGIFLSVSVIMLILYYTIK